MPPGKIVSFDLPDIVHRQCVLPVLSTQVDDRLLAETIQTGERAGALVFGLSYEGDGSLEVLARLRDNQPHTSYLLFGVPNAEVAALALHAGAAGVVTDGVDTTVAECCAKKSALWVPTVHSPKDFRQAALFGALMQRYTPTKGGVATFDRTLKAGSKVLLVADRLYPKGLSAHIQRDEFWALELGANLIGPGLMGEAGAPEFIRRFVEAVELVRLCKEAILE